MLPVFFRALALSLCLSTVLQAQVDRATLSGTISDTSGARLDSAKISIESAATGFHRDAVSSNAGAYQLPGLPVGTFTVSISKTGFTTARFDHVVLAVDQSRTLDAQLAIGAVSTAVEIVAMAAPLDQTSA